MLSARMLKIILLTQIIIQPAGIKARMLANKSGIERSVNMTTRASAAISPKDVTPCVNRSTSWKLADFLGL